MFAPCLLGCPGTTRYKPSADGTPPRRRISCQRASVKLLVDCVNRTPALNPRVRGSSPWRRTRDDLGFLPLQVFVFDLVWGRAEASLGPRDVRNACPSGRALPLGSILCVRARR